MMYWCVLSNPDNKKKCLQYKSAIDLALKLCEKWSLKTVIGRDPSKKSLCAM